MKRYALFKYGELDQISQREVAHCFVTSPFPIDATPVAIAITQAKPVPANRPGAVSGKVESQPSAPGAMQHRMPVR